LEELKVASSILNSHRLLPPFHPPFSQSLNKLRIGSPGLEDKRAAFGLEANPFNSNFIRHFT
jgi:hypothetical protein